MKIKLLELRKSSPALVKIFNMPFENAKLAYSIMKISKKVLSELEDIEKTRFELLKKYGELDKNGKLVLEGHQFKLKDTKSFDKEWEAFMETEIDLDVWMLPLEAIENANLSIIELETIDQFIDEDKRKEEIKDSQKEEVK